MGMYICECSGLVHVRPNVTTNTEVRFDRKKGMPTNNCWPRAQYPNVSRLWSLNWGGSFFCQIRIRCCPCVPFLVYTRPHGGVDGAHLSSWTDKNFSNAKLRDYGSRVNAHKVVRRAVDASRMGGETNGTHVEDHKNSSPRGALVRLRGGDHNGGGLKEARVGSVSLIVMDCRCTHH